MALLSLIVASVFGLVAAVCYSYLQPTVTWINLIGVVLLVGAVVLAVIVFSGLIDYRGGTYPAVPVVSSSASDRSPQRAANKSQQVQFPTMKEKEKTK